MIATIFTIYGIFALAMLIVVWPMLRAAALCDRRDEREREVRRIRQQLEF